MLDLLTLTATEASRLLQDGSTNSVDLVEAYLSQIDKHNHQGVHLNALISVAPKDKLRATAHKLDTERKAGHIRSPFHGIPIVIKDVFTIADLGLPTTAGSPCFASAKAKHTAPVVQHLIDSGLIILGTGNLTEFCGLKYPGLTPGFSPMGGQTQSPYIFGGLENDGKVIGQSSMGGSSSGPAAAVAAGFAPLSVGTECCGSLITPANRGGLYALKCGLGEVDVEGVFRYTDDIDFVGGMAKSVGDLAVLTQALMQRGEAFDLSGGLKGLKVGFCDVQVYRLPEEVCEWPGGTREQMEAGYADAIAKLRDAGAEVYENIDIPSAWEAFKRDDGKSAIYEIAMYNLRNKTMQAFIDEFSDSPVRSLEDIVEFNKQHASNCLPKEHPEQTELENLLKNSTTEAECQAMLAEERECGDKGLGKALREFDVVVALAESPLCRYTTALGCPLAAMPLGTVKYSEQNSRPYGLCAAAPRGGEELLLRFVAGYEAIMPSRPLPRPLLESQ